MKTLEKYLQDIKCARKLALNIQTCKKIVVEMLIMRRHRMLVSVP